MARRGLRRGDVSGIATAVLALLFSGILALGLRATPQEGAEETAAPADAFPEPFEWDLPRGFPQPRVPADNPMSVAKVELGRSLFYDVRLSGNGTFSCASCHRQDLAFTDGRGQALGATHEVHRRGAMSLANVAYSRTLTWADPHLSSLEEQALIPMLNEDPVEMGVRGREEEVLGRLAADPRMTELFAAAFPGDPAPITLKRVSQAIAAFQRTLLSGNAPFDRMVYHGEMEALSSAALRGMDLFFSDRLACGQCHAGFNLSGPVDFVDSPDSEPIFHNTGLYNLKISAEIDGGYPPSDQGLVEITDKAEDMGRFRAPTLRNIAVTAPYMHDGSLATLDDVLDHYAAGGRAILRGPRAGDGSRSPRKSELVQGFSLSPAERADLLAFLDSLTDQAFLEDPRFASPFFAPWEGQAP